MLTDHRGRVVSVGDVHDVGGTATSSSGDGPRLTGSQIIAFIGLGSVGVPMCGRLVGTGFTVDAFDLDADRVTTAVQAGARAAESAAQAASRADLLLASRPRPEHVHAVMRDAGVLEALRPGTVWADLTTNRIELVKELADAAPEGVLVADSPVTGAVDGARNGRLTLFVGADDTTFARIEPVLSTLGRVIHCGPLGTGNVVKLVTNQLWFIHSAAIGEGFALGLQHGVELRVLWDAIKDSVGDSFVARHDAPSIFAGHYDPSFTLGLCLKDLGLTQELAASVPAELPLTDAAHKVFETAASTYGDDAAEPHVARWIEDESGLEFRLEGDWTPPWEQ